jgi:hypothetical protein
MLGLQTLERWTDVPDGTYTGRPKTVGNIALADSVTMHEVTDDPNRLTNQSLVEFVYSNEQLRDLPKFVSGSIAMAIRAGKRSMENVHVFEGPSAKGASENTGTYGELRQLRDYRADNPKEFRNTVVVTLGQNAGNIMRQSQLDDLQLTGLIVPPNLPRRFGFGSPFKQWWTSNWLAWVVSSRLRISILKRNKH